MNPQNPSELEAAAAAAAADKGWVVVVDEGKVRMLHSCRVY